MGTVNWLLNGMYERVGGSRGGAQLLRLICVFCSAWERLLICDCKLSILLIVEAIDVRGPTVSPYRAFGTSPSRVFGKGLASLLFIFASRPRSFGQSSRTLGTEVRRGFGMRTLRIPEDDTPCSACTTPLAREWCLGVAAVGLVERGFGVVGWTWYPWSSKYRVRYRAEYVLLEFLASWHVLVYIWAL